MKQVSDVSYKRLIFLFAVLLIGISFFAFSYFVYANNQVSPRVKLQGPTYVLSSQEAKTEEDQQVEDEVDLPSRTSDAFDIQQPTTPPIMRADTSPQSQVGGQQNALKQYSGQEFVELYYTNRSQYKNVSQNNIRPPITGVDDVDSYIQNIAESRGYQLQPETSLNALHPTMQKAIFDLQQAASQEAGLNIVLVSGYRSISDQRSIFLNQLEKYGLDGTYIVSGQADSALNEILSTRSIPGYSKHHTGYTADFGCNNYTLIGFENTPCFEWISKDNYANIRRFGLIPSYPQGAVNQGPDPESWEYVWVGIV